MGVRNNDMRSKLKKALSFILVLAILAALGYVSWMVGKWFFIWFGGLKKEVVAGIIAGLTAVTVSIVSLVLSKYYERKAVVRNEHREKKVPIYEKSINFWFKVLMSEKAGETPPSEQEIIKFLTEFTQDLIVWGSDSVLKSFTAFRETLIAFDGKEPPIEGMILFEKYMLEVRKDLGHKNKNLKKGDILALFINDIRTYTGQNEPGQQ